MNTIPNFFETIQAYNTNSGEGNNITHFKVHIPTDNAYNSNVFDYYINNEMVPLVVNSYCSSNVAANNYVFTEVSSTKYMCGFYINLSYSAQPTSVTPILSFIEQLAAKYQQYLDDHFEVSPIVTAYSIDKMGIRYANNELRYKFVIKCPNVICTPGDYIAINSQFIDVIDGTNLLNDALSTCEPLEMSYQSPMLYIIDNFDANNIFCKSKHVITDTIIPHHIVTVPSNSIVRNIDLFIVGRPCTQKTSNVLSELCDLFKSIEPNLEAYMRCLSRDRIKYNWSRKIIGTALVNASFKIMDTNKQSTFMLLSRPKDVHSTRTELARLWIAYCKGILGDTITEELLHDELMFNYTNKHNIGYTLNTIYYFAYYDKTDQFETIFISSLYRQLHMMATNQFTNTVENMARIFLRIFFGRIAYLSTETGKSVAARIQIRTWLLFNEDKQIWQCISNEFAENTVFDKVNNLFGVLNEQLTARIEDKSYDPSASVLSKNEAETVINYINGMLSSFKTKAGKSMIMSALRGIAEIGERIMVYSNNREVIYCKNYAIDLHGHDIFVREKLPEDYIANVLNAIYDPTLNDDSPLVRKQWNELYKIFWKPHKEGEDTSKPSRETIENAEAWIINFSSMLKRNGALRGAIFTIGRRGGNGKSATANSLFGLLGKEMFTRKNSSMSTGRKVTGSDPDGVNTLYARVTVETEVHGDNSSACIDASVFKRQTGADIDNSRTHYSEPINEKHGNVMLMFGNKMPRFSFIDDAVLDRIIIFEVSSRFLDKSQVPATEAEQWKYGVFVKDPDYDINSARLYDAMLYILIQSYSKFVKYGRHMTQSVRNSLSHYTSIADPLRTFVTEMITLTDDNTYPVTLQMMYSNFINWFTSKKYVNYTIPSEDDFADTMPTIIGFDRYDDKKRIFVGINMLTLQYQNQY